MAKPSIQIISVLAVAILAGSIFGYVDFRNAFGTTSYSITTGPGISLDKSIISFSSEDAREQFGLKNIQFFSKSGGSSSGGQRQAVLKVDVPVRVATPGDDVSFQYFVDTRKDLDGDNTFHCADVRLYVYLDTKRIYVTNWLGYEDRSLKLPLKTDKIIIHGVAPGWHDIGLIPEGRDGGCNSGFLQSWGGTAVIFK